METEALFEAMDQALRTPLFGGAVVLHQKTQSQSSASTKLLSRTAVSSRHIDCCSFRREGNPATRQARRLPRRRSFGFWGE
eukprot:1917025-Lingulodinium_polyedra.AAC.1